MAALLPGPGAAVPVGDRGGGGGIRLVANWVMVVCFAGGET